MVEYLDDDDIYKLLEAYSLAELIEHAGLSDFEVIKMLFGEGFLFDLPEELVPI